MLVVITGPSGVGKTTIINHLLKLEPKFKYSVSMTTRKPRHNEVDGLDYKFVNLKEFQKAITNDELVEWSEVYGEYYGRLKKDLDDLMRHNDVLIGIDVQGAKKLQDKYPDEVFIFLLPKSEEALEKQLKGRGTDDEKSLKTRLDAAMQEISQAGDFKYNVVNDKIHNTVKEVYDILMAEKGKQV